MTAELLTPKDAATLLSVSVRTLENWRREGRGPLFVKQGRCVRYARAALAAWENANTHASLTEARTAA
jgi:excisionase family DNA binding protein